SSGWWDWAPSKTALEYLWRTGELAVVRRVGFRKIYDLAERVIPADLRAQEPDLATSLDWACMGALARLGFGTSGEIAAFWELFNPAQVRTWCADALAAGRVEQVDVIDVDGRARASFALPGLLEQAALLPAPVNRMRLLSPFDPMLRDRARAERLFGFHYRIEIYVPEPKRKYGYYVFPLMEGDQMVGRIDMKAERGAGRLAVRALWPEQGVGFGKGRVARLEAELERAARLSGLDHVSYAADWLRLS
ncbi:MAG: YcaQ family DNA glycosylase, partial [Rhodobacteraceae bacterium]|nr:YcaQ family DNA glycosylase [Paracoccaceae bacterium]